MFSLKLYHLIFGISAAFLLYFRQFYRSKTNRNRLLKPPGPKGLPVLGSMLDMPLSRPWLGYDKWLKQYGDIVYFEALGQPMLLLGSFKRIDELFEKKSAVYSDRMQSPLLLELVGMNSLFGLMKYGAEWRKFRRAFHDYFHQNQIKNYHPIQQREARVFLHDLLEIPDSLYHHVQSLFSKIIMDVSYGHQAKDSNDPFINDALAASFILLDYIPGRFLVDYFPALKHVPQWFPGAGFQRKAKEWREIADRNLNLPFEHVQEEMKQGTAKPSVVSDMLNAFPPEFDSEAEKKEAERVVKGAAAIAHLGGSDTTVSAMKAFFLAMAKYPEVQKRAQAEIDAVVGTSRFPEFEDRESLPYVNAIIKEVLRWHSVLPIGVPHMTTEDDEYEGYFIPKGTIVMGLTWSLMHDPDVFEDPSEFKPERYLKGGRLNPDVRDPGSAAFGYGRRICPGRFFSLDSLFTVVSSVLATLDIKAPLDKDGNPVFLPDDDLTDAILVSHKPFDCTITPRSAQAEALIKEGILQ